MNLVSSKVHGILDYTVSLLFIASPWLFDFARGGAETWIPVIVGAGSILMSLFTDYELGAMRRVPLTTHLTVDLGTGLFLALSPWIFGFADYVYLPHLLMGLFEIGAAAVTERSPLARLRTAR